MILKHNQTLILKEGKEASKKPKYVVVGTKDPQSEWLIKLVYGENFMIMPKGMISKYYEALEIGRQGELFGKTKTTLDILKRKYLK